MRRRSGPVVSTRGPDGQVIADGEEPKGRGIPDVFDLGSRRASRHACTDPAYLRSSWVGQPAAHSGGGRRYSLHDVELLRQVQHLSQDEGVNLAGIKRIIELTSQVEALQSRLQEMAEELAVLRANQRREVAVVPKSTALVVWKPRR